MKTKFMKLVFAFILLIGVGCEKQKRVAFSVGTNNSAYYYHQGKLIEKVKKNVSKDTDKPLFVTNGEISYFIENKGEYKTPNRQTFLYKDNHGKKTLISKDWENIYIIQAMKDSLFVRGSYQNKIKVVTYDYKTNKETVLFNPILNSDSLSNINYIPEIDSLMVTISLQKKDEQYTTIYQYKEKKANKLAEIKANIVSDIYMTEDDLYYLHDNNDIYLYPFKYDLKTHKEKQLFKDTKDLSYAYQIKQILYVNGDDYYFVGSDHHEGNQYQIVHYNEKKEINESLYDIISGQYFIQRLESR